MNNKVYEELEKELQILHQTGKYKQMRYLTSSISNRTILEGYDRVLLLCSNNYLGLSDKQEIIEAGVKALKKYGAGAASVRFICGTFDIHRQLEERLAGFLKTESALTYTSCWDANTAVIPVLLGKGDAVISDELNHASIIDGCKLIDKNVKKLIYKHADMTSLKCKLDEAKGCDRILIVTDGVFSMEGDIAPLPDIMELAEDAGAMVMVDDSHATGVIGKSGRGTTEYFDMMGKVDIITGTFGKALGGAGGGFVAARSSIIDLCTQRSRPYLFSNSLSPVHTSIALASIEYLETHPEIVESLKGKADYFRTSLKNAGIDVLDSESAILPVMVGDTAKAIQLADAMLHKGIYVTGFGYPVVPEGKARIRIQVSETLSYSDMDYAVQVLRNEISNIG